MRKFVSVFLLLFVVFNIVIVSADNPIKIYFQNRELTSDVEPYIENGRTMVPVRMVTEAMGYDVLWDQEKQTVTIVSTKTQIVMVIGSREVRIGNQTVTMDVPAVIQQSRTFVPIRFVAENFGYQVEWNQNNRSVLIATPDSETNVKPTPTPDNQSAQQESANTAGDIIVSKIFTERTANQLLVKVQTASGRVESPQTMTLENPKRYVLDIPNAILKSDTNALNVESEYISKVRFSQFTNSPNVVRIVIDLNKDTEITYGYDGGFFTLYIKDSPSSIRQITAEKQEGKDSITVSSNTVLSPDCFVLYNPYRIVFDFYNTACTANNLTFSGNYVEAIEFYEHSDKTRITIRAKENAGYQYQADGDTFRITVTDVKNNTVNQENSKKLIVLDPGHGGTEVGALGKIDGKVVVQEKDLNLTISNRVLEILLEKGYHVIATRTTDTYVGLTNRADIANSANAALFVSIHNNSYETSGPQGTLTMYAYDEAKAGASFSGKTAAAIMQKDLVKGTEGQDRGLLQNAQIVVLKKTNMPAILVECLFMSNDQDLQELLKSERLEKIAVHIAEGVENIYKNCLE